MNHMKKSKIGLVLVLATAVLGVNPVLARIADPAPAADAKPDKLKFQGKVEAVDTEAKTLKVDGKLIYITDTTQFSKAGKAIKFEEIAAGEQVHGTLNQTADGKSEALTVMVTGKAKEER
jgi:hypothetical protein